MSLKRFTDKIGYTGLLRCAAEAIFRIPNVPEPKTEFADKVWAEKMPENLKGKTYAITGSSRGIGFVLAQRIAKKGGNVILLNRESKHSQKAFEDITKLAEESKMGGGVLQATCDLCDFKSVRSAAQTVKESLEKNKWGLDCIVLNAGLMAQGDHRTKDGYDVQMQANHLSHFLLTSLLFDVLKKTAETSGDARIVSHSSGARHSPDEELREDSFEKEWAAESKCKGDAAAMNKWHRYQQSKRANLAFTYALQDYIEAQGNPNGALKALCAHPGATNSGLQAHTHASAWLDRFINGLAVLSGQSIEDGCLGVALAAVSPDAKNGELYGPEALTGDGVLLANEREKGAGYSKEQLKMIWDKSIVATGAKWE